METDYPSRRKVGTTALVAVFVPPIILLALTVAASVAARVPLATFSRDPTATLQGNPLTGVQSHLGVLVWWAGAVICFFASYALKRAGRTQVAAEFLVWSGAITAVLTLDDLFQFHEDLGPRYLRLDEKIVVAVYGAAVLAYLVRFGRLILRTDYPMLAAGLLLFAASSAVDLALQDRWVSEWRIFAEDGFKLFGIASWSGYMIRTSHQLATGAILPRTDSVSG